MNFILEDVKEMKYHTDFKVIFEAFQGRQVEFNWLITDLEYVVNSESRKIESHPIVNQDIIFITGEELTKFINTYEIQFIWGVFTAIDKSININVNQLSVEPYANGNKSFWNGYPVIQYPNAVLEIICWDSYVTLLLSKDEDIDDKFQDYFKSAKKLGF
ncbi:hypothetical protein [Bacillus cereus]|uniref:hypothetical protein n=1 Tax=Bacillus cereus TaxID=1396 RepID=UPI0012FA749B|nr:hypothetical protein [Bacillus cereus]